MVFELLKAIFGYGKPQRPARVPTDEILPVHDFDARPQVRDIIIGWTLRFDDVLDADKLNVALSRLLEIGNWRKLGGRLRQRVSFMPGTTGDKNLIPGKSSGDNWLDPMS